VASSCSSACTGARPGGRSALPAACAARGPTAAADLEAEVAADDQVLADAQRIGEDGHRVRAPVHRLLQLVQPAGLEGDADRLLELAVREAPAGTQGSPLQTSGGGITGRSPPQPRPYLLNIRSTMAVRRSSITAPSLPSAAALLSSTYRSMQLAAPRAARSHMTTQ